MHSDLKKLVDGGRLGLKVAERLDQLAPDKYCLHTNLGVGKSQTWDLSRGKIVIQFSDEMDKEMDLRFALQKTKPIADNDFKTQKFERLDELKSLAQTDPVTLVTSMLENLKSPITKVQFDALIKGDVVTEEDYPKWWSKVKRLLMKDRRIQLPIKRTDFFHLRDENESLENQLCKEFRETSDIKTKIKVLEKINKEIQTLTISDWLDTLLEDLNQTISSSLRLQGNLALALLSIRDELLEKCDCQQKAHSSIQLGYALMEKGPESLCEATSSLSAIQLYRLLQAVPEAFGDNWQRQILTLLDKAEHKLIQEIYRFFKAQELEEIFLDELINKSMDRSLSINTIQWICRNRDKISLEENYPDLLICLINELELITSSDRLKSGSRLKTLILEDKTLITDLVQSISRAETALIAKRILVLNALSELEKKSLMARLLKINPDIQDLLKKKMTEEPLISSFDSIKRKQKELDILIKDKIPKNTEEISLARAHGDLRENFEYKAAKQNQRVLMKMQADLERDLNKVQGTNFEKVNTDTVNIGVKVKLKSKDQEIDYTVLGAWDSKPEKRVVSYLSKIGENLLGKKTGDSVVLMDLNTSKKVAYEILSISSVTKGKF